MREEVLYDPAFERSFKNNLGPGPQAYGKLYMTRDTDRFKSTAFPKQRRRLTEGKTGPGPTSYKQHTALDKYGLPE